MAIGDPLPGSILQMREQVSRNTPAQDQVSVGVEELHLFDGEAVPLVSALGRRQDGGHERFFLWSIKLGDRLCNDPSLGPTRLASRKLGLLSWILR